MKQNHKQLWILFCIIWLFNLSHPIFATRENEDYYIKWVEFSVPKELLQFSAAQDINTVNSERHIEWIKLLSVTAARCGGDFRNTSVKDLDSLCRRYLSGEDFPSMTNNQKLYAYYLQAYDAILGGMLGSYRKQIKKADGTVEIQTGYGIMVYSPLAQGYDYNHYNDFGSARNYGYKRQHLGHDLMGSIGTPVVAVEAGYVEACGWNQYGGWRIGIRSFDGKRYYYYAHLKKDHPYNDIYKGKIVAAGEVIGYLGMTGYSRKENVNNINVPHLHYGLQLIFDKSQKDGSNQIWIDLYELTRFLESQKATVFHTKNGEYESGSWIEPFDFWD